jgi:hypothetical protein
MKLRTIPKEYEAIQFNGINSDVEAFLIGSDSTIYKSGNDFVLSNFIGNQGVNIGDYLYKIDSPLTMIAVVHNNHLFNDYFEVVE